MKMPVNVKRLIMLFILLFGFAKAQAQISFPKGNVIDTVIHVDVAYNETQIIFNTGKYKSSDYLYRKISDSLHPDWLVTACFNGECFNELGQSGKFLSEFGLNDTTCFIAFHVESHDINGKSKIRYKVINSKDSTDQAILSVDVTYVSTTGFENLPAGKSLFKYYPNPASQVLYISAEKQSDFRISIIDLTGKSVLDKHFTNTTLASVNIDHLAGGMYFLKVQNGSNVSVEKLVIK